MQNTSTPTTPPKLIPESGDIAIVASRFNEQIVDRLLTGALQTLRTCAVPENRIKLIRVPGALEIPIVANRLARDLDSIAIIALGSVIRGETVHFDLVLQAYHRGISDITLKDYGVPITSGVLGTENLAQAMARSGERDNCGSNAAQAAVEMANLMDTLYTACYLLDAR